MPKRQLPEGAALLFCPGCRSVMYALGTREAGMVAGCTACKFWIAPPIYGERVGQLAEWLLAQGHAGKWPTLQDVYDEAVRLGLPCRPPENRQPMNSSGEAVDDASAPHGLAQTTTPSGAGPTTGARNADHETPPGPAASGNGAGDPTPGT